MPSRKVTTCVTAWIYFQVTAVSFKIRDSIYDFRNNIYYDLVKVIGKLSSRPQTEKNPMCAQINAYVPNSGAQTCE